ncbi:MAG: zinc ribbon domain-containing protein [Thermodesulfovibrionales bacterium]|nr:zinc ribbon domain-containing protein [Thermodesulfovibrionales bacterium]
MNYTKCNATLPEGNLFCPNCGYLNESGATSKPISSSVNSISGLRDNKLITAFADKSNSIALIGGLLVILSFFLTFLVVPPTITAQGAVFDAGHNIGVRNILIGGAISAVRLLQAGEISLVMAALIFAFIIVGICFFLLSLALVFFALRKQSKTALASLIAGICGLVFLSRYFLQDNYFMGPRVWTLGGGFYLLIVGVLCLLISGGSIFFDEKSIKKEKVG